MSIFLDVLVFFNNFSYLFTWIYNFEQEVFTYREIIYYICFYPQQNQISILHLNLPYVLKYLKKYERMTTEWHISIWLCNTRSRMDIMDPPFLKFCVEFCFRNNSCYWTQKLIEMNLDVGICHKLESWVIFLHQYVMESSFRRYKLYRFPYVISGYCVISLPIWSYQ